MTYEGQAIPIPRGWVWRGPPVGSTLVDYTAIAKKR